MLKISCPRNPQDSDVELSYNNLLIGVADEEDILLNLLDDVDYNSFLEKNINCFDHKKYAKKITELKSFVATR